MARELIEVCPDTEGWRVLGRDTGFKRVHYTKFQAIQHASTLAVARHKNTGRSTGVSVATSLGTPVLVACCG
jgi:hypothetical protein